MRSRKAAAAAKARAAAARRRLVRLLRRRRRKQESEQPQTPIYRSIDPNGRYRSVCVRLCDGFFYPISFSTYSGQLAQEHEQCQSSCAAPAELYVYRNPGQEIEQAISLNGSAYMDLPVALKFRKSYVNGCSCKQAEYNPTEIEAANKRAEAEDAAQPGKGKGKGKVAANPPAPAPAPQAAAHRPTARRAAISTSPAATSPAPPPQAPPAVPQAQKPPAPPRLQTPPPAPSQARCQPTVLHPPGRRPRQRPPRPDNRSVAKTEAANARAALPAR